jgi:ribonucleoside-diphosphate reductase alpha chain
MDVQAERVVINRAGTDSEIPSLTENGLRVLRARYLKKDEKGKLTETPAELFRRVARAVAAIEQTYGANPEQVDEWEDRYYRLMTSGRFMPNSPTLMNAGREMGMLSACFVLPVGDSIDEIFDSVKHTAMIQKAGGGTGFAFDRLRPTGDYIKSSGGETSGPIPFWRVFSEATNAIQQGAFRRGANMGMMYVHHPDILKFLHAKQDLSQFTNYNISVKVTDQWMKELIADAASPQVVRNPRTGKAFFMPRDLEIWKYDVHSLIVADEYVEKVDGDASYWTTPKITKPIPADLAGKLLTKGEIWKVIVQNAWQTGEPGLAYIDRINDENPTPHIGRIESTNPCGEQPLLPFEACNLGSVNLGYFIKDPCTPQANVRWDALREAISESIRFLDNVIDANRYPLPQIDAMCKANRKIGLGVMGFADALFKLGVQYNSDAGIEWGERFMKFLNDEAHSCSEALARDRGTFPNWKGSIWDTQHHRPMRNAATTTVAPTGTISIISNCSGGIEPMFSLAFYRNVLKGQDTKPMIEVNDTFRQVATDRGFFNEDLVDKIATAGSLSHVDGVPDDIKHVFVCAHDIEPDWHVKMQAGFQKHCDSSISKTINFANTAKVEQVDEIYKMAFQLGCKGITVYRDGCRAEQPMSLKKAKSETPNQGAPAADAAPAGGEARTSPKGVLFKPIEAPQAPEMIPGLRIRQMTPFGNMHVKLTVDPKNGRELEVFAQLGKGGDVANSDLEAICRMISLWLRAGGSLRHVIKQLKDIGSSLQVPTKEGKIMSLGDGLARALIKYQRAKEQFGLRALLLGEADLSSLDKYLQTEGRPVNDNGGESSDGGNGNGNGHKAAGEASSGIAGAAGDKSSTKTTVVQNLAAQRRSMFKLKCPECQTTLVFSEGCVKCTICGYSQC